jgi:hypothetical protein
MMIHLLLEVINSCDGDLALVAETVDMGEEAVVLLANAHVERSDFFSWSPVVEVVPDRWDRMLAQMLVAAFDAHSTYVAAVTLRLSEPVLCARVRRARLQGLRPAAPLTERRTLVFNQGARAINPECAACIKVARC